MEAHTWFMPPRERWSRLWIGIWYVPVPERKRSPSAPVAHQIRAAPGFLTLRWYLGTQGPRSEVLSDTECQCCIARKVSICLIDNHTRKA